MAELTKYGAHANYRVPPESTGMRIAHYEHWYFKVSGFPTTLKVPFSYELLSSGIYGTVHVMQEFEGGHRLLVTADSNSPITGFIQDEPIRFTDSNDQIQEGVLREWEVVLLSSGAIVDAESPDHHLRVDRLGAASVRFTEGEPQFDAYGLIRMVQPTRLADFVFQNDTSSRHFQLKTTGTGSIQHLPNRSALALDVGDDAGDSVSYTSNRFYSYTPGLAHIITMSLLCGDTGKVGNVRRWGYFSENDGVFWELGDDSLCVVIRTSTSGSITETRIQQHVWNHDRLDGTGNLNNPSGMDLDVTKQNVYWIDFQWHGAGIVRFGVFSPAGKRVICHVFENANTNIGPYMKTAVLPIRWEAMNTTATASPSRLQVTGCGLFREGQSLDDYEDARSFLTSWRPPAGVEITNQLTYIGSIRAGQFISPGVINRRLIVPNFLNYFVKDSPVAISIRVGTEFSSATWEKPSLLTVAEVNTDGVVSSPGLEISSQFLAPGATRTEVSSAFNSLGNALHTYADGTAGPVYSIWAQTLDPSDIATVYASVSWAEKD